MKIFMVSNDYLPNIGGLAAHIYFLSRALQRFGHEVLVIKPVPGSEYGIEKVADADITTFQIRYPENKGKIRHIIARSIAIVRGLNEVFEIVGRPDILHQHDHRFSTFAMQWASRNTPWVWTNHTSSFLRDCDRGWIRRQLIRFSYLGVDGIITASRDRYEKSCALWRDSIVTHIPNGVDSDKFSPERERSRSHFGFEDEEFVVLCPSRMAPVKGVIYMAKAASRLIQRYPDHNWRFVFLGGDPTGEVEKDDYARRVKEELAGEPIEGYVSFVGNLTLEQMPYINACADVIVMPSLMEAVSLSALEGMATLKAVVATNVGGLPQIIHHEETGLLVSPEDPGALADSISRLYRDSKLRHDVAHRARELVVEQYSWEAIARKTVTFYQNTLCEDKIHA